MKGSKLSMLKKKKSNSRKLKTNLGTSQQEIVHVSEYFVPPVVWQ